MKLLRILIIKKFRLWKKIFGMAYFKILVLAGLTHFQFSDGLFFGSICLLFFRFFFRLFFSFNPFWGLNFCVYLLGFFIQLKYNTLKNVREKFIEILKVLLGKNYWYMYSGQELVTFYSTYGYAEQINDINIFDTFLFNKIFQKIFIFFIFFRLWVFKIPYKFIFFNFLLTFFLIFNEYFLFASFCSFIIILSRLCFFAYDYTIPSFFESVNIVEKINPNTEYIESSWENAELIALIISRNFSAYFEEEDIHSKENNIRESVCSRYKQINKEFKQLAEDDSFIIFYSLRYAHYKDFVKSNGQIGSKYKEVIKIKRKKKNFAKFLLCFPFSLPVWFQEFVTQRNSLKFFHNDAKSNFFDYFKFPYLNQSAHNHPVSFALFQNFVLRLNETTPKACSDRPFLGLLPLFEKNVLTGRGVMRTCAAKELNKTELSMLSTQIKNKLNAGSIKERPLSKNFLPNLVSVNINQKIISDNALLDIYKLHTNNALYILPEWFNAAFLAFLDPTCNRHQAIYGMELGIKYLELQIVSPHWGETDKEKFCKLLIMLKKGHSSLYKLTDDCFGDGSNKILEWKLFILNEINEQVAKNITRPPVPIIEQTVKNIEEQENPEYFVQLNFSNCDHISKQLGGKDKITHKGLFPDLYNNKNNVVPSSAICPLPSVSSQIASNVTSIPSGSLVTPSPVNISGASAIIPFNSKIPASGFPDDEDL